MFKFSKKALDDISVEAYSCFCECALALCSCSCSACGSCDCDPSTVSADNTQALSSAFPRASQREVIADAPHSSSEVSYALLTK